MKTKKSINKVALYCRISTVDQRLDNQKIRVIQYAKDHHLSYDLFEEIESSRKTRPVKQALMQRIRNGEYSAVVILKLDRWGRSSSELILDIKEILDKGIGFISVNDNLDFSTASGKLHFQILSAFAEFERELIRERTIEGLHRAKLEGKIVGRPQGKKDSRPRKKSGYIMRYALQKQHKDEQKGIHNSVQSYMN